MSKAHDPQFLLHFLMSGAKTELLCRSCNGMLGHWVANVGLTLTTSYDPRQDKRVIAAKPFAYVDGHNCGLAESEIRDVLDQATNWAEHLFDARAREWYTRQARLPEHVPIDAEAERSEEFTDDRAR